MSIQECPGDLIAYQVLPWLDRSDLLNVRLVDSTYCERVRDYIRFTRGWMSDCGSPRGGVFVRRAIEVVPHSSNDMEYVFRVFQETFRAIGQARGALVLTPPPPLGISLDKVEQEQLRMKGQYLIRFRASLPFGYASGVRDLHSFEEVCTKLLQDPTLPVSLVVSMMEFAMQQDCEQVTDALLASSHFSRLSRADLEHIFIMSAGKGSRLCLGKLIHSSRGNELRDCWYQALEIAKKNKYSECVDLLATPMQKILLKRYALGSAYTASYAFYSYLLGKCLVDMKDMVESHDFGGLTSLAYTIFLLASLSHVISLIHGRFGNMLRVGGKEEAGGIEGLLGIFIGILPLLNAVQDQSLSESLPSTLQAVGLGIFLYGMCASCKLPIHEKTLLGGRSIYLILTGMIVSFQLLLQRESSFTPLALGSFLPALHFSYIRSGLFQ